MKRRVCNVYHIIWRIKNERIILMKKSKKELLQGMSFTIDINKLSLNRRKFITSEIGRGIGIEKNKKGKGSYTRKNVNLNEISYGCFCF